MVALVVYPACLEASSLEIPESIKKNCSNALFRMLSKVYFGDTLKRAFSIHVCYFEMFVAYRFFIAPKTFKSRPTCPKVFL